MNRGPVGCLSAVSRGNERIICTSSDKANDERIAVLVAVLTTDEFKTCLNDGFGEDVLAAF